MTPKPDFEKFEIASVAGRKQLNRIFMVICAVTSSLSIVVLAVLLASIIIAAIPVFGPHPDKLESNSRMLFVQGTSGDPSKLDQGDYLQGIFHVQQLKRGGLGYDNDEKYVDTSAASEIRENRSFIGFFSFQFAANPDSHDEVVRTLVPANGPHDVRTILDSMDIELPIDTGAIGLVVLSSPTAKVDLTSLSVDQSLATADSIAALRDAKDWTVEMVIGNTGSDEFAEVIFSDANNGQLDKVRKTRVRKSAGQLQILANVLFDSKNDLAGFDDLNLRSAKTNRLQRGQIKVDRFRMNGISRRKRNGFDLAGELSLASNIVPEMDASAMGHLRHFLKAKPSDSKPDEAGIGPALWGSIWVCTCCALFALPLGIGTAVFLEEFKPSNKWLLWFQSLIQLNITNLAGVPSIVYGILGLTAFANMNGYFGTANEPNFQFGANHYYQFLTESQVPVLVPVDRPDQPPQLTPGQLPAFDGNYNPVTLTIIDPNARPSEDPEVRKWTLPGDSVGGVVSEKQWYYFQLPFGRGVFAASLTLMLVILPVIIIASQESIRAVPSTLRQAAMGLGATRWQVVRGVTLPAAIPGIMTGAILSISRAIGEAAPLIVLCGTVFMSLPPQHLMDFYSVLPIQIFHTTKLPASEEAAISFQNVAAAASLVLLAVLLTFNTIAIVLRQATSKQLS